MTRLQKNVSVFQGGGQMTPLALACGRPWGPDRIYHACRFIFLVLFSLVFLLVPCGGLKLATRQLFTARRPIHNIVSYRKMGVEQKIVMTGLAGI